MTVNLIVVLLTAGAGSELAGNLVGIPLTLSELPRGLSGFGIRVTLSGEARL